MIRDIVFCIDTETGGRIVSGECSKPLWIHRSSIPEECGRIFHYTVKPHVTISFPVVYQGVLHRFCLAVKDGLVETYSDHKLSDYMMEVSETVASLSPRNVVDVLKGLYKALIAYYHEELSRLDEAIEKHIDRVLKGVDKYPPIYRLYGRASRLHRGVHGLIYSLHRLERIYSELKELTEEAVMLENMYSTSIDRITQAFSLYFTVISDKTNKIVTKLTIISAIFLPLTLIAGIYGMNFRYMPELYHPLGYPLTLTAMALIAIGELIYFKKKKWI